MKEYEDNWRSAVRLDTIYATHAEHARAARRAGAIIAGITTGAVRCLLYHGREWEPITVTRDAGGAIDGIGCREVGGNDTCIITPLGAARSVVVRRRNV